MATSGRTAAIINPPRRGCSEERFLPCATARPSHIIYMSCSPASRRGIFSIRSRAAAWQSSSMPFDMHPGTQHIELPCGSRAKVAFHSEKVHVSLHACQRKRTPSLFLPLLDRKPALSGTQMGTLALISMRHGGALVCDSQAGMDGSSPGEPAAISDTSSACGDTARVVTFRFHGHQVATESSCRAVRKKLPGEALGIGGRHVLFVNYDGADIRASGDNSMENLGIRDPGFKTKASSRLDGFAPRTAQPARARHRQDPPAGAKWYADFDIDVSDEPTAQRRATK